MLKEKIENDLKEAMKQKDDLKRETLRFIKAALQNTAIQKMKNDLPEEEIIQVIKKLGKQHQESIELFQKGGRADLVQKEEKELAIIKKYLPEELSEEEIVKLIIQSIEENKARGKKDMGRVIKSVMEKARGKADGKVVSMLVSKELEKKEENDKDRT